MRKHIVLVLIVILALMMSGCAPFSPAPPTKAILEGRVLVPEGAVRQVGGQALPGAIVNVIDPVTGNIVATTTTDANGYYRIEVPPGGPYIVEVVKGSIKVLCVSPQVEAGKTYDLKTADATSTAVALVFQARVKAGEDPAEIDLEEIEEDPKIKEELAQAIEEALAAGEDPTTAPEVIHLVNIIVSPPKPAPAPKPTPKPEPEPEPEPVPTYNITIASVVGGAATVTTDPADAAVAGTTVTVNISNIQEGKQFYSIAVTDADGNPVTTTAVTPGSQYTFTMPAKAVTITVTLEDIPVPTYTVTFTITPEEAADATVEVKDSKDNVVDPVTGEEGVYKLTPGAYTYTVSKDGYKDVTDEFTVTNEALTITVNLELVTYTVTLTGEGLTSAPEAGEIPAGTSVTITVTPPEGKQVATFTVNDEDKKDELVAADGTSTYTFTITADTEIKVTYEEIKYTLTLTGEGLTSAPEAGEIPAGTKVTITVTPPSGKQIATFTVNGVDKKGELVENKYTFTITADTTVAVTYIFTHSTYKFTYTVPGKIISGQEITVPVTFETDVLGEYGYDGVRFNFAADGPGDVTFKATDSNGVEHTFTNEDYWGPEGGFDIPAEYNATTNWKLTFSVYGTYTITFRLIDAATEAKIDDIEDSVTVDVSSPGEVLPLTFSSDGRPKLANGSVSFDGSNIIIKFTAEGQNAKPNENNKYTAIWFDRNILKKLPSTSFDEYSFALVYNWFGKDLGDPKALSWRYTHKGGGDPWGGWSGAPNPIYSNDAGWPSGLSFEYKITDEDIEWTATVPISLLSVEHGDTFGMFIGARDQNSELKPALSLNSWPSGGSSGNLRDYALITIPYE